MKRLDCAQGSAEWIEARLGIPTASQFHRIIQPVRLKPSTSQKAYINELLAEWLLGTPQDDAWTEFMERGTELEDEARLWYELDNDLTVDRVGFCTTDNGSIGASPDGLLGENTGLEIKCPGMPEHIGALIGEPSKDYKCQIQGGLWVCERDKWVRLSYNRAMPNKMTECGRDEEFIAALSSIMDDFLGKLARGKEKLRALGCKPADPVTNESVLKERSAA
jgi:hypothetical protein